jgi:hypothetical protein
MLINDVNIGVKISGLAKYKKTMDNSIKHNIINMTDIKSEAPSSLFNIII